MVSNAKGHQTIISGYFDAQPAGQLKRLSAITGASQAALLREALDDLLKKYASKAVSAASRRTK